MTIGVLAVQGAFLEHITALGQLGAESFEIRRKKDLERPMDGLVLPGGESTTMGLLLHELDMFDDLKAKIEGGLPVFGTCAGLILLAKRLTDTTAVTGTSAVHFGCMDICARRNAYGRQLGSFRTVAGFKGIGEIDMTFIRAPYIESAGGRVEVLSVVDGNIVAAREDKMLVTAFHPELTEDLSVHKYFLNMIS